MYREPPGLVEKRGTADLATKGRGQFLKGVRIVTTTPVDPPVKTDSTVHTQT